jgi:Uma2 family endonuclease
MVMPMTQHWTTADVRELTQEDRPWPRYELIAGELRVTPAPRGPHQTAAWEISKLLDAHVSALPLAVVMMSPAVLELKTGTIVQPDVFVGPKGIAGKIDRTPEWSDIHGLLLAVEVLSPGSLGHDRNVKRDFHLANHVDDYWIVDIEARAVKGWLPKAGRPEILRDRLVWSPRGGDPPVIALVALFERIDARWDLIRGSGTRGP